MRILFNIFCSALIVVGMCFVLNACNKKEQPKTADRSIKVKVQSAESRAVQPFIKAVGTLNPYEEVMVSSEVDGILKEIHVDEGSAVSRGMLLALIDSSDYALEVKRSRAAMRQGEATLANMKLEYKRKESLYREQLVTQQQFEDVSTRLSLAEAEIERLKAAVALSEEKLNRTRIKSPTSGVIKERKVSRGDYIRNGTHLCTIVHSNPIKLNFSVIEKESARIKTGEDVSFQVDAFPGKVFNGRVTAILPCLDEATRSLKIEAQADNREGFLKPGFFAHVTLVTGASRNSVLVPITALLYEAEKTKIFVVQGSTARERVVSVGSKYGETVEILKGLQAGEQVVVVGQQNLSGNSKVSIIGN